MTTEASEKPKLAPKQKRVLDLLNKGKTPTQVAKTLKISVNGIYGHMRRIEAKGYEVPRSTEGGGRPKKVARKASPNGPVKAIDAEIAKLEIAIRDRQKQIAKEVLEIKSETAALETRADGLLAETSALEQRQKALAAASA